MLITSILQHAFTGKDNKTTDIGRILWAIAVFSFIGIGIYAVMRGQAWSASEYGLGLSALLGGGGAGIAVKAKTEPEANINQLPPQD